MPAQRAKRCCTPARVHGGVQHDLEVGLTGTQLRGGLRAIHHRHRDVEHAIRTRSSSKLSAGSGQ